MTTTWVVVTGVTTAASNDKAMTKVEEKRGVDLLFFPVSSALRWTINVIAGYITTIIAIDDN